MLPPEPKIGGGGAGHTRKSNVSMEDEVDEYNDEDDLDEFEKPYYDNNQDEDMEIDEDYGIHHHQKPRFMNLSNNKNLHEERKGSISYLDRCKEVGRIGPKVTKIDASTAMGTIRLSDEKTSCLNVEGVS